MGRGVVIDLTEVTFLNEAGAVVLRRLRRHPSVSLVGCQLFTRQMIEAVDPV
jgi:anti-anti-sigma regulatory factor